MYTFAVRPLNRIGRHNMMQQYTNGAAIVQDRVDVDIAEHYVEAGGEHIPLVAALESLLFVTATPVDPHSLAETLQLDREIVLYGLRALSASYIAAQRGLRLQERNGKFQLVTLPAAGCLIETFLHVEVGARLSRPALETLAVVAYRQPVTRAQIEAVRGVDCASVLRSLLQRGLIEEMGRLEVAGRPILYGVTDLFLQHFGLASLDQLPPLGPADAGLLETVMQRAAQEEERAAAL
jgi:segregation and condensation protein B